MHLCFFIWMCVLMSMVVVSGRPGDQGPPGATGAAGPTGRNGQVGGPGPRGPDGSPGSEGPRGQPGIIGVAGKRTRYLNILATKYLCNIVWAISPTTKVIVDYYLRN